MKDQLVGAMSDATDNYNQGSRENIMLEMLRDGTITPLQFTVVFHFSLLLLNIYLAKKKKLYAHWKAAACAVVPAINFVALIYLVFAKRKELVRHR